MSLSTSPEYLAKHGVRGVGGPLDGRYIDDGALLWRCIPQPGGYYRLTGTADGLTYVWEPRDSDLAPLDTRTADGSASND